MDSFISTRSPASKEPPTLSGNERFLCSIPSPILCNGTAKLAILLKPSTPILLHSPSVTKLISHIVEKISSCVTNTWPWELKISTNYTAELNPPPLASVPEHFQEPLECLLCICKPSAQSLALFSLFSMSAVLGKLLTKPHFQSPP